jgi:hypothetical protein
MLQKACDGSGRIVEAAERTQLCLPCLEFDELQAMTIDLSPNTGFFQPPQKFLP